MRALIVGLGGIGRRHARNLRAIAPDICLAGCRTQARTTADLGEDSCLFEPIHYDIESALAWRPDIGIVSTPASLHVPVGLRLARAGVHLFIEKPLSVGLDGVAELLQECRRRSLVLMVGYNLRFDTALQAVHTAVADGRVGPVRAVRAEVGQFLPDWRPGRDHRRTCSASAELGGGVLFELSHEFDYIRWIAGEIRSVSAYVRAIEDLEIDAAAVAEVVLEFNDGIIGSIHLDMIDRSPVRRCRVVGRDGTLTWDGITGEARLFSATTSVWTALAPDAAEPRSTTYTREMKYFLARVADAQRPVVDGEDGLNTLRVVLAAAESAATGRAVAL